MFDFPVAIARSNHLYDGMYSQKEKSPVGEEYKPLDIVLPQSAQNGDDDKEDGHPDPVDNVHNWRLTASPLTNGIKVKIDLDVGVCVN